MFTVKEAMEVLNLSKSTIYRLVENGTIKAVKIGGSIRIPQAELRRFILEDRTGR
ncbi:helix-turn-helix domain-containing protein [Anoxybacillus sediminis]|nr:helix-turn-helix domain-containing protein [Anoxybacillus sediminis]